MISYRNILIFKIADIWFQNKRNLLVESDCAFVHYHDVHEQLIDTKRMYSSRNSTTLQLSLLDDENIIMENIEKNTRYEIKRAKRDGVVTTFYEKEQILNNLNILKEFNEQYRNMHRRKGMKRENILSKLKSYAKHNMLTISVTKCDGRNCAYHAYIVGNKIVRLLYSVSVFREVQDSTERNLIGRANRMLHYDDMIYFKNMGYSIYDWGGYSKDPNLVGINKFKNDFGGKAINTYHYIFACSTPTIIALFIKQLRYRLHKIIQ